MVQMSNAEGLPSQIRPFPWAIFTTFLAAAAVLILLDMIDGVAWLKDVDDSLRAIQIRHLVNSGDWFDLTLPMIRSPEIYVSPWSRLVDLPYVAIVLLLRPLIGTDVALSVSFNVCPPLMLSMFCGFAACSVRNLAGHAVAVISIPVSLTTAFLMTPAVWEFTPGRIDHHNVQIVLFAACLYGISSWNRFGGVVAGIALAMSAAVGLECLPFVVVAFAGVIIAWIYNIHGGQKFLLAMMPACAIATPVLGIGLIGPGGFVSVQCDAFSAPYISAFTAFPLAAVAVVLMMGKRKNMRLRFLAMALAGIAVLTAIIFLYPECLSGPYQMIDPLSRHLWLDNVEQEHSALVSLNPSVMLFLGISLAILLLVAPVVVRETRAGQAAAAIVFAVAAASMLMTFIQLRYFRFPFAFVPLLLPLFFVRLQQQPVLFGKWRILISLIGGIALPSVAAISLEAVFDKPVETPDPLTFMAVDSCKDQDFGVLTGLSAAKIIAPAGIALAIAERAHDGISVAGIPFHRASPGIRRSLQAFVSDNEATRREALASFDYVAVCRFPLKSNPQEAPLYAALSAGQEWPGLIRVAGPKPSDFQLFRIDHDRLR
jgi:hypothetical protein